MSETESKAGARNTGHLASQLAEIQPRLYGFILRRIADREQTLEVLQKANVVICEKFDEAMQPSEFVAWAFTIARFQVMAWRKSVSRERLVFSESVYQLLDREPEEEVESVDRRIPLLRQCLERLKPKDRELVSRRYRDGEQAAVIADRLSVTVDSIYMRLMRIRRQLSDCVAVGLKTGGH